MENNWKDEEPWISVLGVLFDVHARVTDPDVGLEQIRSYIPTMGADTTSSAGNETLTQP